MIWKLTIYAQQYRIYFEQVNQRVLTLYVELWVHYLNMQKTLVGVMKIKILLFPAHR